MSKVTLISCLYPNKCAGCDEIIEEGKVLCDFCSAFIESIDYKDFCVRCGLKKDKCRCKYREYHFEGIGGVYKNDGIAKKVYYSYKLGKMEYLADFFAEKAVETASTLFPGIRFDSVCAVPTALRSRLRHGFDHSGKIAEKMARMLNTEYIGSVLRSRHFRKLQHGSRFAVRLENVRGKYYTVGRINKKCVLLFDDIYTTGATLDECAKELLFAGANKVYCVTVLATDKKKKPGGVNNSGN